jgi:hypothetical protein
LHFSCIDYIVSRDEIAREETMERRTFLQQAFLGSASMMFASDISNASQQFTKPLRIIVPFPAGGVMDAAGRVIAQKLAQRVGQPVIVESKSGASGMIAASGVWRIMPEMEPALRRMGERGDIIKTMHRDLVAAGIHRAAGENVIFDGQAGPARVVGRLVAEGVSDELHDRRYVIVDGIDGRTHYADLGVRQTTDEPLIRNTIVEIRGRGRPARCRPDHRGRRAPQPWRLQRRTAS